MNHLTQTQVWPFPVASAGDCIRQLIGSHRLRCLALAVCALSLFHHPASAGVIVPLLSEEAFARPCATTNACGSLTSNASERLPEDADDSPLGYDRSAAKRQIAAQMAAFPPGCGAPISGSGDYSAGSPTICTFSSPGTPASMRSIGRVATEFNLVLPVLPPTELLDPPRVAV